MCSPRTPGVVLTRCSKNPEETANYRTRNDTLELDAMVSSEHYKTLGQEMQMLRIQRNLALALSRTNDLTEALNQIMLTVLQIEGIDCGGIYRVDPATGTLNLVIQYGLSLQFMASVAQYQAHTPQAQHVMQGVPLYVHYATFAPANDEVRRSEGLRTLAILPVRDTQQRVIAALNLASRTCDDFPQHVRLTVETIAAQIGGAIARLEAADALRQAHIELERRVVERTQDLEQANQQLEQTLLQLHTLIAHIPCVLFTLDAHGVMTFADGQGLAMLGLQPEAVVGTPIFTHLQADAAAQESVRQALAGTPQSFTATYQGRTLAVHLIPVAQATTTQRVIGLSMDMSERVQAETRLQQQLERLSTLRQIDLSILENRSLPQTFQILLDYLTTHLGVDAATIRLYNQETQTLDYVAGYGTGTLDTGVSRACLGCRCSQCHVHTCQTIQVPDIFQESDATLRIALQERRGYQAYYTLPLIVDGQVKGVLELLHRHPLTLDEAQYHFLETLAGQVTIAIRNHELFDCLHATNQELMYAYDATITGWARALELRDNETAGHSHRVTSMSVALARALGLNEDAVLHIRRGAILHDIGKMVVPDSILLKPGQLTTEEWAVMRQHPSVAHDLLAAIPFLQPALDIPAYHHERWDGSGYPYGLAGAAIPLAARLFSVVDVWDALSSDRPYRLAWSPERVRAYLQEHAGTLFDPQIVTVFLTLI